MRTRCGISIVLQQTPLYCAYRDTQPETFQMELYSQIQAKYHWNHVEQKDKQVFERSHLTNDKSEQMTLVDLLETIHY